MCPVSAIDCFGPVAFLYLFCVRAANGGGLGKQCLIIAAASFMLGCMLLA